MDVVLISTIDNMPLNMPDKDRKEDMESLQHFTLRKRESSSFRGLFVAIVILIIVMAVIIYFLAI